ncbi:hypothetical protein V5O48_013138 [Marasmius crinis-equi]|uniref:Ricin B lectin domain-containing protein n=1 Tax=Marasmius crinis-equi TaxID=585013 RepID=A0ABR3F0W1_9AGAR
MQVAMMGSGVDSSTTEKYLSLNSKTKGTIQDGTYRITTQGDDQYSQSLYLATDSGSVKAFPGAGHSENSLWRITRIYTPADSFNINSPVPLLASPKKNGKDYSSIPQVSAPRYKVENVGSGEFLGLSRSRLILITTKDPDTPLEVAISPTPSPSNPTGFQIYTTLPDEVWGTLEEYYLHVGIWQLTPEGKPVIPAPILLASKVFPESDCVWGLELVERK